LRLKRRRGAGCTGKILPESIIFPNGKLQCVVGEDAAANPRPIRDDKLFAGRLHHHARYAENVAVGQRAAKASPWNTPVNGSRGRPLVPAGALSLDPGDLGFGQKRYCKAPLLGHLAQLRLARGYFVVSSLDLGLSGTLRTPNPLDSVSCGAMATRPFSTRIEWIVSQQHPNRPSKRLRSALDSEQRQHRPALPWAVKLSELPRPVKLDYPRYHSERGHCCIPTVVVPQDEIGLNHFHPSTGTNPVL
jgi:hypothetical protein